MITQWPIKSFVYGVVILLNLSLGLVVYLRRKENVINRTFFLFVLGIVSWLTTLFLFYAITTPSWVLFLGRLNFATVVVMVFWAFEFTLVFPERTFSPKRWQQYLIAGETLLLFLLTLFTPLVDKDEIILGESRNTVYGPLYPLFNAHFILFVGLSIGMLIKKLGKLSGVEKTQLYYVIWGFSLTAVFGFTTNILIPLLGHYDAANFGPFSTFFLVGILTYAIVRYRFMDIRLVLGRGAVYLLSFATIIFLAFFLMFLNNRLAQPLAFNAVLILGAFSSILFFQLIKFYEKIAGLYFYHTFYNTQIVIADLEEKLTRVLELETLSSLIINTLKNTLSLEKIGILTKEIGTEDYLTSAMLNFREEELLSIIKDGFLPQYLEKTKESLASEELVLLTQRTKSSGEKEKLQGLQNNLEKIGAGLCLPLIFEGKVVGIIVLGNKLSGEAFSNQDIELLTALSLSASIALKNASLYSEVKNRKEELERFYRLTVGRELKIVELERKIQEMEERFK